ncbi:MAG TPA: hypothetical protein VIM02_11845 [Rhizomicrobium sp.]|jgi:hypothetical protein
MSWKISLACAGLLALAQPIAAQSAGDRFGSVPHFARVGEANANREALMADATRIAVRASLPADGNPQLSQQELMSILLLTSLQNASKDRMH